jgi:hypothetical protein
MDQEVRGAAGELTPRRAALGQVAFEIIAADSEREEAWP